MRYEFYLGRRRRSCGRGRPLRRFGTPAFEDPEFRATGATHGTPLGSCAPVISINSLPLGRIFTKFGRTPARPIQSRTIPF